MVRAIIPRSIDPNALSNLAGSSFASITVSAFVTRSTNALCRNSMRARSNSLRLGPLVGIVPVFDKRRTIAWQVRGERGLVEVLVDKLRNLGSECGDLLNHRIQLRADAAIRNLSDIGLHIVRQALTGFRRRLGARQSCQAIARYRQRRASRPESP